MDAKFIEELLSYPELSVGKVEIQGNDLHIYCGSILERGIDVNLGQTAKVVNRRDRVIYELPILKYRVVLHVNVRQYKTGEDRYYWEELSFCRAGSHYTKRYELDLYEQCKGSDVSRVARKTNIGPDTLQGIYHYYAKKNLTT